MVVAKITVAHTLSSDSNLKMQAAGLQCLGRLSA